MAIYEMTGTIKQVMDKVTFDSGFTKREFIVTVPDDRYPQDIKIETVKEKCETLNGLKCGQPVRVAFAVNGNEYNGKFYVNLRAIKVATSEQRDEMDQTPPVAEEDVSQAVDNNDDMGPMPF